MSASSKIAARHATAATPLGGATGATPLFLMQSGIVPVGTARSRAVPYREAKSLWAAEIERRISEPDPERAPDFVDEMIAYHLSSGGKRMRAVLPIWVCQSLGGRAEDALDLGAGIELLHNATLIHDDLQDGDTHRRDRATVWYRWGAAQAINAGDALIFRAFSRIARAPAAPRLLGYLSETFARVVHGQTMEFQLQLAPGRESAIGPSLAVWETMARCKTGALFAACLRAGAEAAGADADLVASAARYGDDAGLMFQVQDDYLDLVGNKGRGRRGSDLMEGKLSFPIVWALERVSSAATSPIRELLARPRAERTWEDVDVALSVLRGVGALDATAAWLETARLSLERHPLAATLPGWIDECLVPVSHALAGMGPVSLPVTIR